MTQDEIIAMATQVYGECDWHKSALLRLEAFVKLVAAKAIAELESQEPVAWRNAAIRVGEGLCSVGPFEYYDMTAKQWLDWALSVVTVHTAPPQRTWVGLASEDRLTAKYMQDAPDGIEAVIDYIEAKLKEKNT